MKHFWIFAGIILSLALQTCGQRVSSHFNATDFVFDLLGKKSDSKGKGGSLRLLTESDMPSLENQGVSFTLLSVDPCGINLHNIHQYATEIVYVIDAEKLQVGFIEENGGRIIVNNISTGMVTFFPTGLVHYQMNLGCRPAKYLSSFNSEDPGVQTVFLQTFKFPDEALSATFSLSGGQIAWLRNKLAQNIAGPRRECLARCKLTDEQ